MVCLVLMMNIFYAIMNYMNTKNVKRNFQKFYLLKFYEKKINMKIKRYMCIAMQFCYVLMRSQTFRQKYSFKQIYHIYKIVLIPTLIMTSIKVETLCWSFISVLRFFNMTSFFLCCKLCLYPPLFLLFCTFLNFLNFIQKL